MIDDALILRIERLRDELDGLRLELRARCRTPSSQVDAKDLRKRAAGLAEIWMVQVSGRGEVASAIGADRLGDLNVQFQRILTYTDHATIRKKYDVAIGTILKDFRVRVVVPLKQLRGQEPALGNTRTVRQTATHLRQVGASAFLAQSFGNEDRAIAALVRRALEAMGISVVTGEKPRAGRISEKVKSRIDRCDVLVGLFTRRDKIQDRDEWTTSPWLIDEKAYALAKGKKLVLLKEAGVSNIGGLQGDAEFIAFERSDAGELIVRLIEIFHEVEP